LVSGWQASSSCSAAPAISYKQESGVAVERVETIRSSSGQCWCFKKQQVHVISKATTMALVAAVEVVTISTLYAGIAQALPALYIYIYIYIYILIYIYIYIYTAVTAI
jgi:hypothetical protein